MVHAGDHVPVPGAAGVFNMPHHQKLQDQAAHHRQNNHHPSPGLAPQKATGFSQATGLRIRQAQGARRDRGLQAADRTEGYFTARMNARSRLNAEGSYMKSSGFIEGFILNLLKLRT